MICSYKSWTSLIDIQRNTSLIWNKNTVLSKFCSIFNVQIVQNSYYISCSFKSLHCLGCCCTNDQNQLTWVNIVSLILDCQMSAVTKANPVCGVSWLLLVFPVKTLNKVLVCGWMMAVVDDPRPRHSQSLTTPLSVVQMDHHNRARTAGNPMTQYWQTKFKYLYKYYKSIPRISHLTTFSIWSK